VCLTEWDHEQLVDIEDAIKEVRDAVLAYKKSDDQGPLMDFVDYQTLKQCGFHQRCLRDRR
jgi:hypothetical protein